MTDPNTLIRRLISALITGEYVELTDQTIIVFVQSLDPAEVFFHIEELGEGVYKIWHRRFWMMTVEHRLHLRAQIQRCVADCETRIKEQAAVQAKLASFIPDDKKFNKIRNKMTHILLKYSPERIDEILSILDADEPSTQAMSQPPQCSVGNPKVGNTGSG